jgi:4-amino-4-deoxy-L-arabinose transferase-like glycosyltransferase
MPAAPTRTSDQSSSSARVVVALIGLFALNLLLRVFYLRYDFVNGDEGLRALTAVRVLEGARLYVDVVTDKPPGATLFYAAVIKLFGRSMPAVHLAAIVWNYLTAVAVFLTARTVITGQKSQRTAILAALLFVYFSTNYLTQDMMAANTELLMVLPYTMAFWFFIASKPAGSTIKRAGALSAALLIGAGILTGLATMFKQVAVLNLLFFACNEALDIRYAIRSQHASVGAAVQSGAKRLGLILLGFLLVVVAFWVWLSSMGAVADFWRNAVSLNLHYVDSERLSALHKLRFLLSRGLSYVAFNLAIWIPAIISIATALKSSKQHELKEERGMFQPGAGHPGGGTVRAIALWGGLTLAGGVAGGRFFGHYFIPLLPALSLLGALGLEQLRSAVGRRPPRAWAPAIAVVMAVAFLFSFVRFHQRTAILAYETLTGRRTERSQRWGMSERQAEADVVAAWVRERIAQGDPLYIWGYAHDVFWRTGCRPASRYLTPYYVDGRFPDSEGSPVSPSAEFWKTARANLIADLEATRPQLILEVYGSMRDLPYPELARFVRRNYREIAVLEPSPDRAFRVLELKTAPKASSEDR